MYIILNALTEGSSVVGGSVSASSQSQAQTLSSGMQGASFSYPILSSSVGIYYDDQKQDEDKDDDDDDGGKNGRPAPIGAIVGGTVGGLVAIGIVAFIVYKVKKAKAANNQVSDQDSVSLEDMRDNKKFNSYNSQIKSSSDNDATKKNDTYLTKDVF